MMHNKNMFPLHHKHTQKFKLSKFNDGGLIVACNDGNVLRLPRKGYLKKRKGVRRGVSKKGEMMGRLGRGKSWGSLGNFNVFIPGGSELSNKDCRNGKDLLGYRALLKECSAYLFVWASACFSDLNVVRVHFR